MANYRSTSQTDSKQPRSYLSAASLGTPAHEPALRPMAERKAGERKAGDTGFFRGGGVAYGITVWFDFRNEKSSQLPENLLSGESLWDAYREPKSSMPAKLQFVMFLLG